VGLDLQGRCVDKLLSDIIDLDQTSLVGPRASLSHLLDKALRARQDHIVDDGGQYCEETLKLANLDSRVNQHVNAVTQHCLDFIQGSCALLQAVKSLLITQDANRGWY
jgi:hypothetical protein